MNDMDDAARPDGLRNEGGERPHVHPAPEPVPWNRSEAWNISDDAVEDPADPVRPLATLVSFHYLRAAVRRRWRACVLFALLGVFLGVAFLAANPVPRTATTTLRLTHQEGADPSGASATDISLMTTRTPAERTIKALGLNLSSEDLMNSVKAVPSGSPEILQLTMSAPTDAEAVRRLDRFTKEYLNFRARQISAQSDILIKGYEGQIAALRSQAQALDKRIEDLAANGDTATARLTDAVTEQSQVNDKIGTLQATVDDATLRQVAVVSASRVIDPAAAMPPAGPRRMVLVLASGLIGGLAIGFGVVLLRAILSDRLWLRIEVAAALSASVLLSVRRITPRPRLLRIVRFLPWLRARDARRAVELQRMAHTIEQAVLETGHGQSVAVVCLGNSDEMRFGLVAAAIALQRRGRTATIVDLTEAGRIASAVARSPSAAAEETPAVFRPRVVPSLAKGPYHIDSAEWEDVALVNGKNRITLILADLDPAVGVDHLTGWTDSVIVAVTAGKSSAELVRTTGDLVRSVGLQLRGAVLLGAVRDDMSSGIATRVGEGGTETAEPAVSRPDRASGRPLTP
jgi:capsular polysaccharide biosynthesis protein